MNYGEHQQFLLFTFGISIEILEVHADNILKQASFLKVPSNGSEIRSSS